MNYVIDTDLLMQLIERAKNARDNFGQAKYILDQIITDLSLYPLPSNEKNSQSDRAIENIESVHQALIISIQRLDSLIESLDRYVLRLENQQNEMIKSINVIISEADFQIDSMKKLLTNGMFVDVYCQNSIYSVFNKPEKTLSALSVSQVEQIPI